MFKKICKAALVALTFALLSACGGDSGGNIAYPFRQALTAYLNTAGTHSFNVTGTMTGFSVTGSGALANTALSTATFQGSPAQQQTSTITGTISVNGSSQSLNEASTAYYDANFNYLGSTGADFLLASTSTNSPDTVYVGSAGEFYRADIFSDITFSTVIGTEIVTWAIERDAIADSALLTFTTTEYDLNNNAVFSSRNSYHLRTNGTLSPVTANIFDDTSNVILTFTN